MNHYAQEILLVWGAAAIVMLAFWIVQIRTHVAGIVDVVWALGTAASAVALVAMTSDQITSRDWLVSVLLAVWGARLALHLILRLRVEREDGRYLAMRQALGTQWVQPVMFLFFQLQALWAVLFALPALAASLAPRAGLDILDAAGILVWIVAIGGEWLADRQLSHFKADPANKGRVCRLGLWRYSRHPNYFFEWIHWLAYMLIGYGSPYWWVTLAGFLLMYLFLNYVTGIPFTEQQTLRSRGREYRAYQKSTSRFIPWPPKTEEV